MWTFLGGLFKSIAIALGMAQQHHDENNGAIAQREKDKGDELNALSADRVRDGNADLQQRVRDTYGIDTKP